MLHPKLTEVPDTPGRAQLVAFLMRRMLLDHKRINLLWGRMNSPCSKLRVCDRWVRRSLLPFSRPWRSAGHPEPLIVLRMVGLGTTLMGLPWDVGCGHQKGSFS